MINWLKTQFNPVPTQYDCLLLMMDGEVVMGRAQPGMVIVAWSVVNKPDWFFKRVKPGKVRGENHPKARLSDADVETIIELYGDPGVGLSYAQIAEKFECSKSTVRDVIKCRTRNK